VTPTANAEFETSSVVQEIVTRLTDQPNVLAEPLIHIVG